MGDIADLRSACRASEHGEGTCRAFCCIGRLEVNAHVKNLHTFPPMVKYATYQKKTKC